MTNTEELERIISDSGLRKGFIADSLGISRYGLNLKIQNKNEFKSSEIKALCAILKITRLSDKERIFFA